MALDNSFFENIKLRLIDGKYYNADEVNDLLEDIEQQSVLLNAENRLLNSQLSDDGGGAVEIFFSAQELASRTLEQTRVQAGKIIEQARKQAKEIEKQAYEEAERIKLESSSNDAETAHGLVSHEFVLQYVEQCFNKLRKQQTDSLDIINEQWRSFLCGLMPEEAPTAITASIVEPERPVANSDNKRPSKPETDTPPSKSDKSMVNTALAKPYNHIANAELEDDDDTDEISMLTKKVNTIANELSSLVGKNRQGL